MSYRFTYQRSRFGSSLMVTVAATWLLPSCAKEPGEQTPRGIEISSQGAALTAVENTEVALLGIVDTGGFLADSTSLAETLNALGGGSESCSLTIEPCDAADVGCVPETTEVCTSDDVTEEDLQQARADIREAIDDLVTRLREEVFIEANLDAEGTNATQVTYRLGPDVLCEAGVSGDGALPDPTSSAPAPEPSAAALDPECVANAERANLRVRLSQPNPNDVDMTFIVGQDDVEPLTLQLYDDRIGVKVDLAEGLKAMESMGEEVEQLDSLEGLLQLQLVKNAALDYSLQFSVLEEMNLSMHDDNGDNISYSLGAASPAVELNVDGNTKTISATYNYSTMQWLAPLRMFADMFGDDSSEAPADALPEPDKQYSGVVEMMIPGYTGTMSYTADSDEFRFSNVSLGQGTSTLKHNENVLASVDLNPNDGRGFDVVIRTNQDDTNGDTALVSIDPTIDLNIAVHFAHIADQVDVPETMMNDKLRMWFEGGDPTFSVEENQVRMVSGSFHLSSEQSPESNVNVDEGMCLVEMEAATAVSEPLPTEGQPVEEAGGLFEVRAAVCQ